MVNASASEDAGQESAYRQTELTIQVPGIPEIGRQSDDRAPHSKSDCEHYFNQIIGPKLFAKYADAVIDFVETFNVYLTFVAIVFCIAEHLEDKLLRARIGKFLVCQTALKVAERLPLARRSNRWDRLRIDG